MSVRNALYDEFLSEIKAMKTMEIGSTTYKSAIEGVTKLADRIIELDKLESENESRNETQNNEREFRELQITVDKRDKNIRNAIEAVKVIGGFGLAAWAFVASMNFEKEGTFTTEGGRNAVKQLLRFIK